jgi:Spy/CpxP family protein refolding chaperone
MTGILPSDNSMIEEERKMKLNLKKMSGFIAIAAALLLATVVGFSQQGRPPGPPPGGGFRGGPGPRNGLGPLARDLNLSDEQKAQIKKITDSFEESTKALRDQLRTLHESEPDPLNGGTFDEAAVRAAAQARANVQVELEVAHARLMSQVSAVLTTEQKAQLAAKRQEFEQRHSEGPPRGDVPNN